jgi:hypothetical protein
MLRYVANVALNVSPTSFQKLGLHLSALTIRIEERIKYQLNGFSGNCFLCTRFASANENADTKQEVDDRRAKLGFVKGNFNVAEFSTDRIRNFCIIAHVSKINPDVG